MLASSPLFAQAPPPATAPALPRPAPGLTNVPDGARLGRIKFVGLAHVDEGYLLSLIRTRAGDSYNAAVLTEDIDRLQRTGKFDDVAASVAMEQAEAVVTITVLERQVVASIEFVGNQKFKEKDLLPDIGMAVGSPISEYTIKKARDALERKYKEAGYYYVKIDVDPAAVQTGRIVITISEGPRVRIRRVVFDGNTAYTAFKLRGKVDTKSYLWIFRKGELDDERLSRDDAALAGFYHDDGYLDAEVSHELQFAPNGADVTVRFLINEGVRYYIRNLVLKGNTVFPDADLRAAVRLTPGQPLVAERMKADVKSIRDKYGQAGYIYADARADWVYAAEPGLVDLTYTVVLEGRQYRFGRVIIRGNRRTQDRVVRRELEFHPLELYDTTATERSEQRLKESRLFSEANITPIGDDPDSRDALVDVKEASTTSFLFGVGVTSNNGLVGNISLENRNFDLFDWPRDFSEFVHGRAFRGAGQTARIQFEPGTQLNRFRIDFREPFLFDQPYGFNESLYLFTRRYREYRDRRIGFNTSFDHRFKSGPLRNWSAEAAFRVENVHIGGVKYYSAEDFQDVKGSSWLTSIKGTLVRNTTDSIWVPSTGSRLALSWEQYGAIGGDYTFSKVIADYAKYFTVYTDTMDRKHIIAVGGTAGDIFGDGPVFERFYGGGIGSIRGFAFRGVTPRKRVDKFSRRTLLGQEHQAVGGDFELLLNAEYSFPVAGTPGRSVALRGVTFLDMGTVEPDESISDWRSAVGIGARLYLPFFGPIPLSFDLATPISKAGRDDTQVFSFSFASTF